MRTYEVYLKQIELTLRKSRQFKHNPCGVQLRRRKVYVVFGVQEI